MPKGTPGIAKLAKQVAKFSPELRAAISEIAEDLAGSGKGNGKPRRKRRTKAEMKEAVAATPVKGKKQKAAPATAA